jgi:Fic family protein
MMTLRILTSRLDSVPVLTSWYLADLGEARGKQALFTKQSPQKLKVLREHALIESAVSSNRIEGVEVDQSRIATVVFGTSRLRDRNEEEIRGYRAVLEVIHEDGYGLPISEPNISQFHRRIMEQAGDAGQYRQQDSDIIEKYPDGRAHIRFKTVSAAKVSESMCETISLWYASLRDRKVHPLIAMAAMNLDFLCIHPFRDGNGRVSRLLLLLTCYHLGIEVGRYISLERVIEQNKERYYETLFESSQGWHEGTHDPWPYINYILATVKAAYREFEQRAGEITSPRGSKTELLMGAIQRVGDKFRVADLQRECPGVSLDMIRRVLKDLRSVGRVECLGRGQQAEWRKTDKWELGNT